MLLGACGIMAAGARHDLLITVVQTSTLAEAQALLDTNTYPASSQHPSFTVLRTRRRRLPGSVQQVRVMQGRDAFISIGRREPGVQFLWEEETHHGPVPTVGLTEHHKKTGFHVLAEINKGVLTLDLTRYDEQPQTDATFRTTGPLIHTIITGRPGEWLDIGGTLALKKQAADVQINSVDHGDEQQFRLLVKAEVIP